MDKTTKFVIFLVVVLIILLGVFSFFGNKDSGTGPIKIGWIGPLSGDAAIYGEPARRITEISVNEINQAGGIKGRTIELIAEDGKCNGKDAASAAQKLINVDRVQAIIGGFCSGESLAALPVAEAAKIVLFSAGSSSPDLTGKSPYFFRDFPSDDSQGTVIADVAYKGEGFRKVGFIVEQSDYALGVYKPFASRFQNLGGQIVKEEFATGVTDFRSQLAKLKAQNLDALFVDAQTPAAGGRILAQLSELNWKPRLLVNDILQDPKIVSDNRDLLEGAIGARFNGGGNNPKYLNLVSIYKEKYGSEPPYPPYAQTEYDAMFILKDGMTAIGFDGAKLSQWLGALKNWPGASGSVSLGTDGDRVGGHVVTIIKAGVMTPYSITP